MIELNLTITIKAEYAEMVIDELRRIGLGMSSGLGVAPPGPSTADPIEAPQPNEPSPPTPAAAEATAAEVTAPRRSSRKAAPKDEPAAKPPAEEAKPNGAAVDRAAVVEGLTAIYSKGSKDVRATITQFRDDRGADRLRDLKDEDLPEAAALLATLKLEAADAV